MSPKVLLVGWDAADWKIIQPLMDANLMPATRRLVESGVMANIATLHPVFSPMLWTSIATGKRPYKHEILGFTEPIPGGAGVQPVTNLSRKTKAVWNILCQNDKKSNVVGWWPSHPAEPIDGVMVSNHFQKALRPLHQPWPMRPGTVHPESLSESLAELRVHPQELEADHVRPFLPEGHRIDQDNDTRLTTCVKIIADCTSIQSCATHLMESQPWDFMAVYFDAIDHFSHAFMRYHPPQVSWVTDDDFEVYRNVVTAGYVYHDMMLARLVELAGPETTVILMSDHGFHPDHLRRKSLPSEPAGPAAEHREHGIFVMCGPNVKQDELIHGVSLLDVTPTILTLFGLPIGKDMDGRVLTDAFDEAPTVNKIDSWDDVSGSDGTHPPQRRLDAHESQEGIDHLVALGYIEPPSGDSDKAACDAQRELDYNLALAYIDGGLHGEAVPILLRLYTNDPLEFRFGIQLAICLQALGHIDDLDRLIDNLNRRWRRASQEARGRLREIREIASERRTEQKAKSDPSEIASTSTTDQLERLFSKPELHVIKKIRSMARGNPATLDYLAGWVALAREQFDAALEHFGKAGQAQSDFPGFHIQIGEALRQLGRHESAEESYQQALKLDPHNASAYLGLARNYIAQRRHADAKAAAQKALSLRFHLAPAHYCLGVCRMREKAFEAAVACFEKALEFNPNFPEAHERLARIFDNAFHDETTAQMHRTKTRQIRELQTKQSHRQVIEKLPDLDKIDFDANIPKFPERQNAVRLACLAEHPTAENSRKGHNDKPAIVVVSGLPRSGTSLMMQMLCAGGLIAATDEKRTPDESNPRGYFELEKVKSLAADNTWLAEAEGQCLKVVAPLIPFLPQDQNYRIVFLERELDEIVASQQAMIGRLQQPPSSMSDEKLKTFLRNQVTIALRCVAAHQVPLLVVKHQDLISSPIRAAHAVKQFIGADLDIQNMISVVDSNLYRERSA